MSYELGNNIYNYFYEPLKYYNIDNKIFDKALQLLYSFEPHEIKYNIKRIDETLKLLTGIPFISYAFDGKYIRIELENRKKLENSDISEEDYNNAAIWDRDNAYESLFSDKSLEKLPWESESISLLSIYSEEILDNFERDISYFYNSITDYIDFYNSAEKPAKSLVSIKASYDLETNSPLSLLFTRNDGNEFETELNGNDLDYLIITLEIINNESK